MSLRSMIGLGAVLTLASCGGSGDEESTPSTTETTTGGEHAHGHGEGDAHGHGDGHAHTHAAVSADTAWADMERGQRFTFMRDTVMPEMRTMFQEHDAERFAEFGCPTCHGADMQEANFAMPHDLFPLDPAQIPAMFQSEEPMAQFMTQRVWPRMAELLQQAPYDPETQEGFACLNCHATAEGS